MSDIFSKVKRSEIMSNIKSANTKPERVVRSFLHRLGYRFRLHVKKLPGTPDIVLRKYKTVIFVNGCFWHQHPGCRKAAIPQTNRDFWEAKLRGNVSRDREKTRKLEELGWNVITVWSCEIDRNPEITLEKIPAQLHSLCGKDLKS